MSLVVESQLLTLESSSRAAMVANMVNPYLPLRPQAPTSGQPVSQGSISSVMVFVFVNLICILTAVPEVEGTLWPKQKFFVFFVLTCVLSFGRREVTNIS